jgi:hypothetical protein
MKDAARVLLLSAGLTAWLKKGDAEFRRSFMPLFDPTDSITGRTIDGRVPLGKVRVDGGGVQAVVRDRQALIEWAKAQFPTAVKITPGDPTQKQIDDAAQVLRESLPVWDRDPGHADQIAEAMLITALTTEDLHPNQVTVWLESIANGEAIKGLDGTDYFDLPGVEVIELPSKFVVTTNKQTIDQVIEDLLQGSGLLALTQGDTPK